MMTKVINNVTSHGKCGRNDCIAFAPPAVVVVTAALALALIAIFQVLQMNYKCRSLLSHTHELGKNTVADTATAIFPSSPSIHK